ncbi:Dam family site-specific DNA-(adenine-N6)-methyltransferase [Mycoplasmopsis cynos]|uniref:Dam family site-specific DNA-(adenine-N6)-methyltransferase n=1 Tax=Mycoplasmopsis cynos TaxID=171284 RepID=UPI00220CF6D4|nr:Dam family site-specific DNA-(adenine-N6)-methyltransferase [Mycoplasmopsis cynos]UWV82739.1 Dam family site-specific DNA-(adenine-N6)-methyltransferase [Mycoplasmopsis cynos]UWV94032.1 Dam family site-specific DNA-(adenine-N6)-methyltransferase [Mycoplasmopsis cynos]WQQ18313.1 Dam family site-specific DNA-(adenine-N6)-methyltransferase [Mycoplasmopsis cynos]
MKKINKENLKRASSKTSNIIARISKGNYINLESIEKICLALECKVEDLAEIYTDIWRNNNKMTNSNLTPFVKWAGGKKQLINEIEKRLPKQIKNYYEPFVGGGAILFYLKPQKAYINDINSVLINAYNIIKTNPSQIISLLSELDKIECTKETYYNIRDKFNNKILSREYDVEMASLFIFLNKRCFNGLYRVNSKGLFNVPFNNKLKCDSYNKENILNISEYLKNVNITNLDFEESLINAKKGDFIFFDSPYAPLNPTSFDSYTKDGFDKESHIRLSKVFKRLDKKGCLLMLTNHNTKLIRDLYSEYKIEVVDVKRNINSKASNRTGKEVIITNYEYW